MKPLLISKCLLGENVRYDGGNCLIQGEKLQAIKEKFKLFPICPEVMANMSIPRGPIEILRGKIINKKNDDLTDLFIPVKHSLSELIKMNRIKFALLKEFSPSCGVSQIHNGHFDGGTIEGKGLITSYLLTLGVNVYSENDIAELLALVK